jgi:uncharacterized membrane protein
VPLSEVADLLLRWFHVIAGILWIGNSMLFNWLDRNLARRPERAADGHYHGTIWLVHSGAFYEVEKKLLGPHQLPATLHWFQWQNGLTWLSGMVLLVLVYYANDGAFLVDPTVAAIAPRRAMAIGLGTVFGACALYELVWRGLGRFRGVASALTLALLGGAAWLLAESLAGRAAYIHVAVAIGTIMTANVWTVILPAQRALVLATRAGREQDAALSAQAKERSIHNNYLTFPLLFLMLSSHFPSTWGHPRSWLVLVALGAAGAGVRHGMNLRASDPHWWAVAGGSAAAGLAALVWLTGAGGTAAASGPRVAFATVEAIVGQRCRSCHSARPTDPIGAFTLGVHLDTPEQIRGHAERIRVRTVELRTMPFLNRSGMTDAERETLRRWLDQGADIAAGEPPRAAAGRP